MYGLWDLFQNLSVNLRFMALTRMALSWSISVRKKFWFLESHMPEKWKSLCLGLWILYCQMQTFCRCIVQQMLEQMEMYLCFLVYRAQAKLLFLLIQKDGSSEMMNMAGEMESSLILKAAAMLRRLIYLKKMNLSYGMP